jgi:hypothetical protein
MTAASGAIALGVLLLTMTVCVYGLVMFAAWIHENIR